MEHKRTSIIVTALCITMGIAYSIISVNQNIIALKSEALEQGTLMSDFIDQGIYDDRVLSFEDKNQPLFKRLMKHIREYRRFLELSDHSGNLARDIYLLARHGQSIQYGPGIWADETKSIPAGTILINPDPSLSAAFDSAQPVLGPGNQTPQEDSFTLYVPLRHRGNSGTTYLWCITMNADWFDQSSIQQIAAPLAGSLLCVLLILGLPFALRFQKTERSMWKQSTLSVMILGLLFFYLVLLSISGNEATTLRKNFRQQANLTLSQIAHSTGDLSRISLAGLASYFSGSEVITPDEFQEYTNYLAGEYSVHCWFWVPSDHGIENPASGGPTIPSTRQLVRYTADETAYSRSFDSPESRAAFLQAEQETTSSGLDGSSWPFKWAGSLSESKDVLLAMQVYPKEGSHEAPGTVGAIINTWQLLVGSGLARGFHATCELELKGFDQSGDVVILSQTNQTRDNFNNSTSPPIVQPLFFGGKTYFLLAYPSAEFVRMNPYRATFFSAIIGLMALVILVRLMQILDRYNQDLETRVAARTTDLQKAMETTKELASHANAANMAKTEFLSVMSHELRTPLNSILGMTQLMLDSPLSADQRLFVETTMESGRGLLMQVNEILDYTTVESGRIKPDNTVFDPRELLARTARESEGQARQKQLDLVVNHSPNLPESIQGDPELIRQVMERLLDNAIKFTNHGRVTLDCTLEGTTHSIKDIHDREYLRLCFRVSDTGPGIPEEHRQVIFSDFTQASTYATRQHGGLGLGLAISRRLVELMGGAIGVDCPESGGCSFWFTLLLQLPPHPAPNPAKGGEESREASQPTQDKVKEIDTPRYFARVVAADSESMNLHILGGVLRKLNYKPVLCSNLAEILGELEKCPADFVLVHPPLLGPNRGESIRMLRNATGHKVPIIGITSTISSQEHEAFRAMGFSDLVSKPVDPLKLQGVLIHWVLSRLEAFNSQAFLLDCAGTPDPDIHAEKVRQAFMNSFANLMASTDTLIKEERLADLAHGFDELASVCSTLRADKAAVLCSMLAHYSRSGEHTLLTHQLPDFMALLINLKKKVNTEFPPPDGGTIPKEGST